MYRSYRAGNQKFQQFEKIRNRLNNDSFYEKAVYGGGSGGTGPIPYKSAYQSRVQGDPRATDPWRSIKETKVIGKRKTQESSSESDSSHDYKNKKKKKNRAHSSSSSSRSYSEDSYSESEDYDEYDEEYDEEDDESSVEILTSFGKILKKSQSMKVEDDVELLPNSKSGSQGKAK